MRRRLVSGRSARLMRPMRYRTFVLAAALSAGLVHTSGAFVPNRGGDAETAYGGAGARMHRDTSFVHTVARLPSWQALWDRDTDVPLQLWGPGISAANAVVDPTAAESAARAFLTAHLDLLAPGASVSDFTVIANQVTDDLRSVAFEQRVNGLRVIGGAIIFGFKNDRLFVVSSTALPHVVLAPAPAASLARPQLASAAAVWLAGDGFTVRPAISSLLGQPGERVIVPIVRPRIGPVDVRYQVAEQLPMQEVAGPGAWDVWLDATTGAPIARRTKLSYATGTVLFDTPDQSPSGPRSAKPAPFVNHAISGLQVESDATGTVTWAGTAATTVQPGLVGPLVKIVNSSGSLVTDTLTLQPGGTVTWSQAGVPTADAQLTSYVNANTVKAFVKARLNPQLAWLDKQLTINVNINQNCNAFWDGQTLNFFVAAATCENTGRIRDVVFHEFGHGVHDNSYILGLGQVNGSLGEGVADTLAVSITNDSGLGRGFFFNDMPLRELAPAVKKRWPQDADGEVHDEGEIIGETLWDLRQGLIAKLGQQAGFDRFLKIYYSIVVRALDIPSSYLEALAADDDDGDLTNGTPNVCAINAAFGPHGLADPSTSLGLTAPVREGNIVHFTAATNASTACAGAATLSGGKLEFHLAPGAPDTTVAFTQSGNTWSAAIPTQPDGTVVSYKVTIATSDGTSTSYPDNPADPYYQFYIGATTKLYCTDFESGAADWAHSGTKDEWQAGMPMGLGGDPKLAHGGTGVFGTDLSTDGLYKNSGTSYADSPMIDLQGFTSVRLQYYRWLTVEDGAYDNATIYANSTAMWTNVASAAMATTEINHVDKEWRFQDVDLSAQTASGKLQLRFELKADPGLNMGGWTVDDLCVVGVSKSVVNPTNCGNGVIDSGEACDDGNTTDGDGCSATCGIEVTGEMPMKDGGGCCSTGANPTGALALGGIVLGAMLRRRRRR